MEFFVKNASMMILVLFLISEMLASIPGIQANSIFQAIRNFLKGESKKNLTDFENRVNKDK